MSTPAFFPVRVTVHASKLPRHFASVGTGKNEQIIPLTYVKEEVIVRLVEDCDKVLLLLREKVQNQIKVIFGYWRLTVQEAS